MGIDTAADILCCAVSSRGKKCATQEASGRVAHGQGSQSADSKQRRDFPARPVGEGIQAEPPVSPGHWCWYGIVGGLGAEWPRQGPRCVRAPDSARDHYAALCRRAQHCSIPLLPASIEHHGRLFTLDASLRPLFTRNMQQQGAMLLRMLALAIDGLHHPDTLVAPLQALGQRHVGYSVRAQDYDTVGAALLWTLEQALGAQWTEETCAAWSAAYTLLATAMQTASAQVVPPTAA
jgi:hemoglobin-like flavoprotein